MSSPPSLQAPPSPTPPHSATSDTATTTTTTKSRKRSSSASTNQSPASPRSTSTSPVPPVSTLPLPLPLPLPPSLPDHNHQPEQHQPLDDGALPPAAKRLRRSSSSSPAPVSPSLSQSHSRSRSRSPSPQHLPPPNTTSQLSIRVESGARLAYYHSLILKHLSLAHRLLCLTQNGHEACESQAGPMLTAPGALIAPFDDVDALMRFVDPALDVDADADNNNLLPRNIFLIACAIIATCLDLLDPTDSVLVPLSIPLAKLLCQVTLVLCDIYTDDHIVTDVNVYEGFEPNDPLLARQERYAHRISLNVMHQVTDMIARAAWPARGEGASVWFDLGVIKALQVEGMVHFESRVKVVVVEDEVVSAMAWLERVFCFS
ncbi:hypothetical protein BCR44DRAFT_1441665 [Catenaria anguillulae PL171]|uniref:Uncharacterized protein n=1 Tax=Catenaria anguillulae PL171 TaxID=765915 RepID=A0A1Y2HBC2_9FUNG|nr:hypothetical protein BCR44DRAFT_1441665 [Catenaria anguillulae PL171]